MVYCLYDPSSTNAIFHEVSIHGLLGSLPLLLLRILLMVHILRYTLHIGPYWFQYVKISS
jgi:hypothetical protein